MRGCSATSAESWRRIRRPVALPPAWATRRTPWPPSRPSARLPWRSASKRTPSASRSRKRSAASSVRTSAAERRTRSRPAAIVSVEVPRRGVLLRERGGEPALGPVRRRLGQRAGGDQRHARALARGAQARVQARGARADDDQVHCPTVPACPRAPGSATTRISPTTSPGIPSGRSASARSRRRWPSTTGSAASGSRRRAASDELLEAVHPSSYVSEIRRLCEGGGARIDADTIALPGTWEAALRGAGGAAALADALLGDGAPAGVSALRPPGHHAEAARAMGFCFFNNVAVAARRARDAHGADRVLILDWDVHHGNGTNDIFHADPGVLFVSIHEYPLYPGTGPASDAGSGAGEGYTVNLPVPGGSGDAAYRSLVEHVTCALIEEWRPQVVLVSAGFDAHRDDPLATCRVTEAGYAGMTASLRRACGAVGAPLGLVLEGGYDLGALANSMAALMPVLVAASAPDVEDVAVHPLAAQARERLSRRWPALREPSARSGA